jgi:hypothetical protein
MSLNIRFQFETCVEIFHSVFLRRNIKKKTDWRGSKISLSLASRKELGSVFHSDCSFFVRVCCVVSSHLTRRTRCFRSDNNWHSRLRNSWIKQRIFSHEMCVIIRESSHIRLVRSSRREYVTSTQQLRY